jgi:CIC family chloride channel protein
MGNFQKWFKPRGGLAITEAAIIGLVSGLSAVLLRAGIGWLGSWRLYLASLAPLWLVLPLIGLGFGYLSGWGIEKFSLESTGTGIPQVKATLARFPIALNFRVAAVKLCTTILALGGGLTMGRQGPTVHIGAAVAAHLSNWLPATPDQRRQIIAAGAGAGLAAGFNAPLAGTLFVIEELLRDISSLTLGTAILACFIGAVVARVLGGGSLTAQISEVVIIFTAPEIPFYLLLGAIAGVFGGYFNRGILASLSIYQRLGWGFPVRVAIAGLLCGLVVAFLPDSFRNNAALREFFISEPVGIPFAVLTFLTYFGLTLVSYGSGAPGGLFQPSLVLGSSLGYVIGSWADGLLNLGFTHGYVLAGMGAFFSAVSKVPVTAIVIVFEITSDFNLVLPLMISCVSAYLISERFFPGSLYQRLLQWYGYQQPQADFFEDSLSNLTAAQVMQTRVETLDSQMSLTEVIQTLGRSHHRGFPVLTGGKLVGIITQSDLDHQTNLPLDTPLSQIMTRQPITVSPQAPLSEVLYLLNRYQLSRLPVVVGERLVGIITRSDVIRAEADKLNESRQPSLEMASYLVYQTCGPSTGQGQVLVWLSQPTAVAIALPFAITLAKAWQRQVTCLALIAVPHSQNPRQALVDTIPARRLLQRAERLARKLNQPIHTQAWLTHEPTGVIATLERSQPVDLLIGPLSLLMPTNSPQMSIIPGERSPLARWLVALEEDHQTIVKALCLLANSSQAREICLGPPNQTKALQADLQKNTRARIYASSAQADIIQMANSYDLLFWAGEPKQQNFAGLACTVVVWQPGLVD